VEKIKNNVTNVRNVTWIKKRKNVYYIYTAKYTSNSSLRRPIFETLTGTFYEKFATKQSL